MAENIKIVGSILNTSQVSRYETDDLRLIPTRTIQKSFSAFKDYIEYHVYDINNSLLDENYNYRQYKLPSDYNLIPGATSSFNINNTTVTGAEVGSVSNLSTTSSEYPIIEIDPVQDLQNLGYTSGEFRVQYNVFKNKISSFPSAELFIKEISPDRTEVRAGSVILTDAQIESGSLNLINTYSSSSVFDPFLLNFGNNIQELVTNIVLNKADTGYEILFKLYNELDLSIQEKSSFWVVEEISTPYVFDINLDAILSVPTGSVLRGPNFSNLSTFGTNSTDSPYSSNFSNDQEGLFNLNSSQSISINVNYSGLSGDNSSSGFSSFVKFGSAYYRIVNFYDKVEQIESYKNLVAAYPTYNYITGSNSGSFSSSLQTEINNLNTKINDLISNFDGFENYLYFESGSTVSSTQYGITPWPKSGNTKPYTLLSTGSANVITWYSASRANAEEYDLQNVDYFKYSVPGFIVDDPENDNYVTFLNMMGQFFDNIWIYITSVTDINLSNNNLNNGISKDLVYNMLQSLGISIFNSFGNQSVAQYLLGANTGSASYSGSLDDFSATSSYLNNVPKKDILAESYKRIYHNLPLLLQRKGTVAGLRSLLSTFGILNQDYYTISGSTFYTPTGSNFTSSVLNVKEYGGSTTEQLLAGYSSDKIRIVSNITASVSGSFGSVLSPFASVIQYTTASSNFRTADENYVDVSFSPQTQIDTYISKSISSSNSSWLLDDFIGNPQQQYSSSYSDLDTQRKIYFVDGTGSYAGFTGSLLDYNGFIRLVQFFDNSLFKMLEDYVPARTNLSTGVTINSPVLERNKWSYARINNTSNEPVKDGNIESINFTPIYDDFYYDLSGSREAYFNGEISGSRFDVFLNNDNPYLGDLNVYNVGKSPYQQANTNNFLHSDFNVTLNNVSNSLYSVPRKVLELSGSNQILLTTASLQDSYLTLTSYTSPRYDGTKVYSANYNTYTDGDKSFGKSAAIDKYVRKFGLFTQIVSSSFFINRNLTALKYLVDESGSLTELSQNPTSSLDSHWSEVQNTFKLGSTTTVALFDNQQYSNQKTTDGPKTVFDSGYSYYPILYYTGSDSKLYFRYVGKGTAILFESNNINGFINGSTPLRYTASNGYIYNVFNQPNYNLDGTRGYFYIGGGTSFPSYSVPQNANMNFQANFGIDFAFGSYPQSASYTFDIVSGSTVIGTQTQTFTSSVGNLSAVLNFNVTSSFKDLSPNDQIYFKLLQVTSSNNYTASILATGNQTSYTGLKNSIDTSVIGIEPFAVTSSGQFVSQSNGVDTVYFNKSLTGFRDYLYLPSTSSVSLHGVYGNVDYTFSPKVGDVILFYYNNNTQVQEVTITSVGIVPGGSVLAATVSPNLVNNLSAANYTSTTLSKFVLLSKIPDETNLNLSFDKIDGQTSYGFVIPENLSPDVLKNIDVITRQVKQKLLSSGNAI